MIFMLRDYQELAVDDIAAFFAAAVPGSRRLYSSPTGTGKSVILLAAQERAGVDTCPIITPSLEIIRGMLEKQGLDPWFGETALLRDAEAWNIWTPVRYRNRLADALVPRPKRLLVDEAHHDEANTYEQIHAYVGDRPVAGVTATPFRGTPKSTAEFHKTWGDEVYQILSYSQAAERGYINFPRIEVLPLVDDDQLTVTNGEIQAKAAGQAAISRLDDLVGHCRAFVADGLWNLSTMFSFPSTDSVAAARSCFTAAGLPCCVVTGDTSQAERQQAFAACVNRTAALLQIQVVSEGVDLPIRRLIDVSPTLSPVRWLQQIGRIMRPWSGQSEYICTNRNLLRHCYLLDGLVPDSTVAAAQKVWEKPSNRDGLSRAIGLEAIGRFKATELPLRNGVTGLMYNLCRVEGTTRYEYAALCHPCRAEVLYAARVSETDKWGKWKKIDALPDMTGFASAPVSSVSEKQEAWWRQSAGRVGLDPDAKVTRKNFAALPILAHTGERL